MGTWAVLGVSAMVGLGYCIFKRNRDFRRAADNLQRAGENARDAAGTAARLANVFGQMWRALSSARQNIQDNVPNVREIPRPNMQGLGIGPAAAAATILTMPKGADAYDPFDCMDGPEKDYWPVCPVGEDKTVFSKLIKF